MAQQLNTCLDKTSQNPNPPLPPERIADIVAASPTSKVGANRQQEGTPNMGHRRSELHSMRITSEGDEAFFEDSFATDEDD